jgi:hypothetical protein
MFKQSFKAFLPTCNAHQSYDRNLVVQHQNHVSYKQAYKGCNQFFCRTTALWKRRNQIGRGRNSLSANDSLFLHRFFPVFSLWQLIFTIFNLKLESLVAK